MGCKFQFSLPVVNYTPSLVANVTVVAYKFLIFSSPVGEFNPQFVTTASWIYRPPVLPPNNRVGSEAMSMTYDSHGESRRFFRDTRILIFPNFYIFFMYGFIVSMTAPCPPTIRLILLIRCLFFLAFVGIGHRWTGGRRQAATSPCLLGGLLASGSLGAAKALSFT